MTEAGLPASSAAGAGTAGPSGTPVEVEKRRRDGSVRIRYRGTRVHRGEGLWIVEARWAGGPWRGEWVSMEPDDLSREYYGRGHHVAILELMDRDGRLKGYYADICDAIELVEPPPLVRYRDLVLDVYVAPDGALRLLDVPEFLEWVREQADAQQIACALTGLRQLLESWLSGGRPFDRLGP